MLIIQQIHFGWVMTGCLLEIPSSAQTSTPNFDTFFSCPFMVVTYEQMTIKHSMYTQKVPFLYTERACVVFSGIGICLKRKVMWSKVLQVLQTRGST